MKLEKTTLMIIFAAVFCLAGIIGYVFMNNAPKNEVVVSKASGTNKIYVHVKGEVKNPGLYEFEYGDRINDAIIKAGGKTENADVKVTSDNIETLLSLCIDDCGACFCPELLVRRALTPETMAKLRMIRLGEDSKYKIRFGYAKQNYQWHAIDEFINIAVKSLNDKAL